MKFSLKGVFRLEKSPMAQMLLAETDRARCDKGHVFLSLDKRKDIFTDFGFTLRGLDTDCTYLKRIVPRHSGLVAVTNTLVKQLQPQEIV